MKSKLVLLTALFSVLGSAGFAQSRGENLVASHWTGAVGTSPSGTETQTWAGELQVGKTESVILYVGAESGDYAAFCFKNRSKVGRAILAACKNREQCQFRGEVVDGNCKVPGLEASLSASSRILSIKSVKRLPARSHVRGK